MSVEVAESLVVSESKPFSVISVEESRTATLSDDMRTPEQSQDLWLVVQVPLLHG